MALFVGTHIYVGDDVTKCVVFGEQGYKNASSTDGSLEKCNAAISL